MEFELRTSFKLSPKTLFEAWLDSELHSKMTGGEADISDEIGSEFTAWDGYIEGRNVAIERNHKIVQSWRASEFEEEDEDSEIEITFNKVPEGTELVLKHSNLPDRIGEQYKKGWEDYYFKPMKAYFAE